MNKTILITASLLGILSIVIGAFGAHGLKQLISNESLQSFEVGVRYQMYHALLLLFVGNSTFIRVKTKRKMFYLIMAGVLLFSGSIYGLATNSLSNFDFKLIGFITPLGGFLLILSWVFMFVDFLKISSKKAN